MILHIAQILPHKLRLFQGLGKTDNIRAYGKNLPYLLVRMFLSIIPSSPDISTLRVKSNEKLVLSRMSNVELRCTLFTQTYTKLTVVLLLINLCSLCY